jgi:response regulator of citrate/malate metabolism
MKNKKDIQAWAWLFEAALKSKERKPVGLEWKMANELAKDMGLSRVAVKRRLTQMIAGGSVEKFQGTQMTAQGRVCNMTWYRIKKSSK